MRKLRAARANLACGKVFFVDFGVRKSVLPNRAVLILRAALRLASAVRIKICGEHNDARPGKFAETSSFPQLFIILARVKVGAVLRIAIQVLLTQERLVLVRVINRLMPPMSKTTI